MKEPNPFKAVSTVDVTWIVDDEEAYVYRLESGSLVVDPGFDSIRFRIAEVNGRDDSFEVLLLKRDNCFFARFDYPGLEGTDYPLSLSRAADEVLLYRVTRRSRVYIHLSY